VPNWTIQTTDDSGAFCAVESTCVWRVELSTIVTAGDGSSCALPFWFWPLSFG
jgi:hypothetical protein